MYRMYLRGTGKTFEFPVLPETLEVKSEGDNKTYTVIQMGEINALRKKKLRGLSWECHFPAHKAPYVTGGTLLSPVEYIKTLERWRDGKTPAQFIISGTNMNINVKMSVESITYSERGGEPGDLYYSIELLEYKDHSPKRIVIPAPKRAVISAPKRAGAAPAASQKTHKVVRGDCLWNIARKFYGSGSKYTQIYNANKTQIDARNRGTGNPRYTIYPGQVFTIP